VLPFVVAAYLIAIIAMFHALRPALPYLERASGHAAAPLADAQAKAMPANRFTAALTIALVPFFAYYAAWGFLGDTVRDYSRLALTLDPFGSHGMALDILDGWWLVLPVTLAYGVRRLAKALKARANAVVWDVVIVLCEANWAFIGLFVLSRWKDAALAWLADHPLSSYMLAAWHWLIHPIQPAGAAGFTPVEQTPAGLAANAQGLFFYALLPVVWLVIAALIYGYDMHARDEIERRSARFRLLQRRYAELPRPLRDFIAHFVDGYLTRYRAVLNGIRLTFTTSLLLFLTLIIAYRLTDWASAWAWFGLARLIGPHPLDLWQIFAHGLSLMLGSPSQPGDGVLPQAIKICLLAATIERAFEGGREWRAKAA
jgi:hypothetical protein